MHPEKRYYKEIGWLLLIKLCLVIAIRYTFFGQPHDKHSAVQRTTDHLLSASAPAPRIQTTVNRSNHDQ